MAEVQSTNLIRRISSDKQIVWTMYVIKQSLLSNFALIPNMVFH